jgi:hypothetical protein
VTLLGAFDDRQHTRAIEHYLGHRSISSTVRYTRLLHTVSRASGGINGHETSRAVERLKVIVRSYLFGLSLQLRFVGSNESTNVVRHVQQLQPLFLI